MRGIKNKNNDLGSHETRRMLEGAFMICTGMRVIC